MLAELASVQGATTSAMDEGRGLLWVAEQNSATLSSIDLTNGARQERLGLLAVATGLALNGDGAELLLSSADGTLVGLDPDDPGAGPIRMLHSSGASLGQVAASRTSPDPGSAFVIDQDQQDLVRIMLSSGASQSLGLPINGLTGVALEALPIWVAATDDGVGSVQRISSTGVVPVFPALPATGQMTLSADGAVLVVVHPELDRISFMTIASGVTTTHKIPVPLGGLVSAHMLSDGSLLVVGSDTVVRADTLSDLESRPALIGPRSPLFVGSWVALDIDLSVVGLGPDDVAYQVPAGPDGGIVSYARFSDPPAPTPTPLLIAGGLPGLYTVELVELATGTVLETAEFEVSSEWSEVDTGPSRCYSGVVSEVPVASDWGGGPNTPQNMAAIPRSGTWRVAVLMVNTADGAFPTNPADLANAQTGLLNHVEDGDAVGGQLRSLRHYYEEVSSFDPGIPRGLTVRAHNHQIFGPVTLPNGWASYFAQTKDDSGAVIDDRWSSIKTTTQTIVTAAITAGVLTTNDFSSIDSLIIVPFSPDATGGPPARFVWPHASLGPDTFLAGTNVVTDQRSFSYIYVPPDFDVHDGRPVHATLSHETGHNFRLPDLYSFPSYTPNVNDRLVPGWDMMGGSRTEMPHYTLSNRMREGWVEANHLKLYNFKGAGGVNDNITVHAAELTPPPANQVRGIEIRLADGWNYYVEYRAKQAAQFGDTLPQDRRVVISDVTSDNFKNPTSRPPIIFVQDDVDGDGPILDMNLDFEDKDPGTQMDLVVKVVSTGGDSAVVNVQYGSNGKPDPGIRPWTGSPDWQSPDIEVRNARSTADPAKWQNTPWVGNTNTVVAKVRNNGDLLATGARCEFFVIEFTTGDGPMVPLGDDTHDIAPGATVEFSAQWVPPAVGHYCIVARLPLYQDPAIPTIVETNIFNNEARSNYTRFVSASSSPSTRVGGTVELANPFDESTLVRAVVRQRSPFHRVFVEHQWLRVGGRRARRIMVFDEALAGTPEVDFFGGEEQVRPRLWEEPNRVSVEGWADRPFEADCGSPTLTGGVSMRVDAARATETVVDNAGRGFMTGRVFFSDDASPVSGGTVLVVVRLADSLAEAFTATAGVANDGSFGLEFQNPLDPSRPLLGQAHFLGDFAAAPSDSPVIPIP